MKVRIKTAHGYLSWQPDGRIEYRAQAGAWEELDIEGWDIQPVPPQPTPGPTPEPTPPPDTGFWLGIPPRQTAAYVAEIKAALQAQGVNLSGACGAGAISKNVAWGLRGQGAGLLSKPSGNNCEGYATDIVCWPHSAYDILGDGGNANVPLWQPTDVDDLVNRGGRQSIRDTGVSGAGARVPRAVSVVLSESEEVIRMGVSEQETAVVVGGGGSSDGRVVVTPAGQPNVVIKVITPFAAILIRALKTYVQTLAGLMSASVSGAAQNTLPAGDFMHTLGVCAGLSLGAAVMSVLTNLPILLSDLGDKFPTLKV